MKNKKAFTLVELMVAMAIIGILAAVVLVSMNTFGDKARRSKALQTAQSILPSITQCYLKGSFQGTGSATLGTDRSDHPAPCAGSSFTLPAAFDACSKASSRWNVYYDNFTDSRAGSLEVDCANETPGFMVQCWYTGSSTGQCTTSNL